MSDRGAYRSIHTVIIDRADFQALSPNARLVFLIVKLNLGPSGIDVLYWQAVLPLQTGLSLDQVAAALDELDGWVRVERNVVWLVDGLQDEPSLNVANKKHRTGVAHHVAGLPRLGIVADFVSHYGAWFEDADSLANAYRKASESLSRLNEKSGKQGKGRGKGKTETERERESPRGAPLRGEVAAALNGQHEIPDDEPDSPAPPSEPPPASWSARACAAWKQRFGGTVPGGRIGKAMKPLITERGEEEVLPRWDRYCAERDARFASPEEFAAKYGDIESIIAAQARASPNGRRDYGAETYAAAQQVTPELRAFMGLEEPSEF